MFAMVLNSPGRLLVPVQRPIPEPGDGQLLVRVRACAVCRTDLHIVAGELPFPKMPLIPGHEIIGVVEAVGARVAGLRAGDRVGIPWLGWTCGECRFCLSGRENLCEAAQFTGYTLDGGYADYAVADQRYCFPVTDAWPDDPRAAPLLCAGLIGYRSFVKTGDARRIGVYGFGAAAHIVTQIAVSQGREVHAFTKPGDTEGQKFALELGARWAGDSTVSPPFRLDAAIIFAPVGNLVPLALKALDRGGTVVCAGIHMSDIPRFPYELLWQERTVCSVANLTRQDGLEFLALAARVPIRTSVQLFPLREANRALDALRGGRVRGAAVLVPEP
jgi:propanol-preferring alcohol dehydrogenase